MEIILEITTPVAGVYRGRVTRNGRELYLSSPYTDIAAARGWLDAMATVAAEQWPHDRRVREAT